MASLSPAADTTSCHVRRLQVSQSIAVVRPHVGLQLGAIAPGRRVGTHTLKHSYARHLLVNGVPINYLSRWLGHSSIQTTLIYLELVPDPTGSLAAVP